LQQGSITRKAIIGLRLNGVLEGSSDAFRIGGFHEVVLSIRDLDRESKFYQDLTGWSEISRTECSKDQLGFWHLDSYARQCLLTNPGVSNGHIRLVNFDDSERLPIRSSSQSWDTGGIYDIDLRTPDLQATFKELQSAGWMAFSDPLSWQFGKFEVSEVLMKGPDDVVLAIIQRHRPKLEGFPLMKKLSRVFNSSQVVRDMDASKDFYINKLGFKVYMDHVLTGTDEETNLFGMPQNLYRSITRRICILHPEGTNEGSVELIQLDGAQGRDFASHAIPPNLGILLLRFPILNMDAFRDHLVSQDIDIFSDITTLNIPPYGAYKCISIKTPDGALLEFLELAA